MGFSNEDLFGADCSDVVNPSGGKRKNGVCVRKKEKSFLFGNVSSLSPFENFQEKEDISIDNLVSYL